MSVISRAMRVDPPVPAIKIISSTLGADLGILGVGIIVITLYRYGGYTGDVSLALTGKPGLVVLLLAPSTYIFPISSSIMTLTVGLGTSPGTYPMTLTASGSGVADSVIPISLIVT